MKYIVLAILFTINCDNKMKYVKKRMILIDNKPVMCERSIMYNCGMRLIDCEDGYEYYCMTNVVEKGN